MELTKAETKICIKCRRCCKVMTFRIPLEAFDDAYLKNCKEYYMARGCELFVDAGHLVVVVPSICRHLNRKGCKIYDTRPELCRLYDGRADKYIICQLPRR
jgi:Fe-S-cluster containining protein